MREIKFMGKRIDNGEWVCGYYVKYEHMGDTKHIIITNWAQVYVNSYEIDPETLGQYTGLKDKNGVEIYEGDVLHCVSRWDSADMVVIFADGEFRMVLLEKGDGFYDIRCFDKEVIDNIHDNPELLGVGECI